METVVVLPAPFGPRTPTISPRPIANDTPSTATRPANDLRRPRISSIGSSEPTLAVPSMFPASSRARHRRVTPSSHGTFTLSLRRMRRALVAEDDPDIVELVTHYLAADGWTVDARADGRQALELLQARTRTSS